MNTELNVTHIEEEWDMRRTRFLIEHTEGKLKYEGDCALAFNKRCTMARCVVITSMGAMLTTFYADPGVIFDVSALNQMLDEAFSVTLTINSKRLKRMPMAA